VKKSPLKVKDYFVTELSVKANPFSEGAKFPVEGNYNMSSKVETAKNETNVRDWKVALQIKVEPIEKNIGGYSITIELVGFFDVENEYPEDRIGDMVTANAPAVLYGAAREILILITGRGPFPIFSLPCATFIDETPSAKRKLAEEKKPLETQANPERPAMVEK
jgi:preprotein translocase subunit SecB